MYKLIGFFLTFILIFHQRVFAQALSFDCNNRKNLTGDEGLSTMSKVQAAYQTLSSLEGLFDQESYMAALDISELSSGEVKFKKPGLMRWDYVSPKEQSFIVSDSTFWFYQKEQKQVLINSLDKAFLTDLPVSFLLGVGDLVKDFSFKSGCRDDASVILELSSKKNKDKLKILKLLVDPITFQPKGAFVEDVGGNVTSIILRGVTSNVPIGNSSFEARFPKDTDIDDQRSIL